jgi:hypothetical protein
MLELSPKYWTKTLNALDATTRSILTRPWDAESGDVPGATEIDAAA